MMKRPNQYAKENAATRNIAAHHQIISFIFPYVCPVATQQKYAMYNVQHIYPFISFLAKIPMIFSDDAHVGWQMFVIVLISQMRYMFSHHWH